MNIEIGSASSSAGVSGGREKLRAWAGWTASGFASLMLVLSAAMKLAGAALLAEKLTHLGWPIGLAVPLGVLELACVAIYLVPATSVLGAILLYGSLFMLQPVIDRVYGLQLSIDPPTPREWLTLGAIVLAGVVAGLIPALRAYRLSVADGMTVRT